MKRMTKLLLVHWHYFVQEVIEFDKLNFLTGKNASGKSTIIDAMQLILLGDTSGNYFNKAANGRGTRTLMGYLKGELGDDENMGFKYLRNGRFTSYIAMEFFDEDKNKFLTAGCCFDIYSENDVQKLFFSYDGGFPDNNFVDNSQPMDITALRAYIKEHYDPGHSRTTDIGKSFREYLYGKLGGLRNRFGTLLKKAVSFNPNVDIQNFISEFVCDIQQSVDVSGMQENIRNYKNLEQDIDVLKARINFLENICNIYDEYKKQKQNEMMYSYLIDQSRVDAKEKELSEKKTEEAEYAQKLKELERKIEQNNNILCQLKDELVIVNNDLYNDQNERLLKQIEGQIKEKTETVNRIEKEYNKIIAEFARCLSSWRLNAKSVLEKRMDLNADLINPAIFSTHEDLCTECAAFLKKLDTVSNEFQYNDIINIDKHGFAEFSKKADDIRKHSVELSADINREKEETVQKRKELEDEKETLEKGMYRFPKDVSELKTAVSSRLRTIAGRDVSVNIVAEAAEIKNDRWRNVIEGYLNTQKFYIIVPQEYFKEALEVFNLIKRDKAIYGTGIVDVAKIRKRNPEVNKGSLAEEIITDNADVRIFIDYVLGRVQKCDNIYELRSFHTAVTDDGMLYKSYVVRAMNPKLWQRPAIGQSAIIKRLEDVKKEIENATAQIAAYASMRVSVRVCDEFKPFTENEAERIIESAKEMATTPAIKKELIKLNEEYSQIDTSTIDEIKKHKKALEEKIKSVDEEIRCGHIQQGSYDANIKMYQNETIPKLIAEIENLEGAIENKFEKDWIDSCGQARYQEELYKRGVPEQIEQAFGKKLSRASNAKDRHWQDLRDMRKDYNGKYHMGYAVDSEDNDTYEAAWLELSDNKLPEYLTRIEDSRTKAFEQFREDFLSRLQSNIYEARRQIDDLNRALSGRYFGEDAYRFRIVPKQEYKRYYDMIVDDMLLEGGYNLFSEMFNAKYKDEITDLFSVIADDKNDSESDYSDYERRVRMFTDYRTYLSFDLEVINKEGEVQRLSKTMGKKSGGETQTPFYIAVLASFAQLYRVERDGRKSTARLIIFDEAFSKMDGERIVRSIDLLRQFDFQAIISAPPEKIGDIAGLVDRNLCVLREGKHTCVRSFAKEHIKEIEYE